MRRLVLLAGAVSAMLTLCLLPGTAQAQLVQTFVSGTGDDTNVCSRAAPCATWNGAFAKTAAGEIDALDPGSYGNLVITKAITIDGGGGQVASTITLTGANSFIVSVAGPSSVVTLRNLRISGAGNSGISGIVITEAGTMHIENCNIFGFSKNGVVAGTAANTKLIINDTTISDNLNGIQLGPTAGDLTATFERVRVHNNLNAGVFLNASGAGVAALVLGRSTLTLNGTALLVEPNGQVILTETEIAKNGVGVAIVGGGQVVSFGNNPIGGNGMDGPSLTTALLK